MGGIVALSKTGAAAGVTAAEEEIRPLDMASIAREFPIKAQRSYLNNASIGPLSHPVIAAIEVFLHDVRDRGRNNYPIWCNYADDKIKGRIARLIGARASEIAFVKNTTEGLVTVANGLDWRAGDNVIIANIEYPSNVYCWMRLAKHGVSIRWVKSKDGRVTVDALAEAIDSKTRLISLSAVQFSNGFRHDLALTSELCAKRRVLFNLDGIQWVGALEMDVSRYHIDFMAVGGQKWLLAPIGTGFFYCNQESLDCLDPPSVGYHSVDKGEAHMDYELAYRPNAGRFEEALVNFPGIWGLDAAVKILLGLGSRHVERHVLDLTAFAAERLKRSGCEIVSPVGEGERSGILSFRLPRIGAESAAEQLRVRGIDVAVRGSALRISPSYYNDRSEIEHLVRELSALHSR
ncbi:MAG TPA: aminotransferase class V-fold PLP-dependent enzyme [Xanthobacteraceae bacterium]|nr:aminotransferase class V-fold PLP-dependent enzyme [Xanthobacteraceae bacterium]